MLTEKTRSQPVDKHTHKKNPAFSERALRFRWAKLKEQPLTQEKYPAKATAQIRAERKRGRALTRVSWGFFWRNLDRNWVSWGFFWQNLNYLFLSFSTPAEGREAPEQALEQLEELRQEQSRVETLLSTALEGLRNLSGEGERLSRAHRRPPALTHLSFSFFVVLFSLFSLRNSLHEVSRRLAAVRRDLLPFLH